MTVLEHKTDADAERIAVSRTVTIRAQPLRPATVERLPVTPAETRLLANLFAGHTLAETAATLGITRPTAKTHLEHIFLKTKVTRQAELMRLWTRLISPTG